MDTNNTINTEEQTTDMRSKAERMFDNLSSKLKKKFVLRLLKAPKFIIPDMGFGVYTFIRKDGVYSMTSEYKTELDLEHDDVMKQIIYLCNL